ncbi:hypothetical protein [Mycobacterium sp. 852013-51886_SCH5428379]|uniref:hypothetical protein n=1 Tax=Mycobacterium sp. 852013-51886_SCH5428379 TaxID=1834111 RepID=UPI001E5EC35F|nr:hypothetical protein [Mycobacterium sp. 852013-51886_SCH5428379]
MSLRIDRVDPTLGAVLDRGNTFYQISCGAVSLRLVVSLDLKTPVRPMHCFEPSRLRDACGLQSVNRDPVSIYRRSGCCRQPTLDGGLAFARFTSGWPNIWSHDET